MFFTNPFLLINRNNKRKKGVNAFGGLSQPGHKSWQVGSAGMLSAHDQSWLVFAPPLLLPHLDSSLSSLRFVYTYHKYIIICRNTNLFDHHFKSVRKRLSNSSLISKKSEYIKLKQSHSKFPTQDLITPLSFHC